MGWLTEIEKRPGLLTLAEQIGKPVAPTPPTPPTVVVTPPALPTPELERLHAEIESLRRQLEELRRVPPEREAEVAERAFIFVSL